MAVGRQIILRCNDNRVLAPDPGLQRAMAASVLRVARPWPLLGFSGPDTHLHLQSGDPDPESAVELGRRVAIGLSQVLGVGDAFETPRHVEVRDQRHQANLFEYVLGQARHHGTAADPCFETTSLPDLLGLRVLGGWLRPHVRRLLPRVDRAQLIDLLGCDPWTAQVEPDLDELGDATAAAVGTSAPDRRSPLHCPPTRPLTAHPTLLLGCCPSSSARRPPCASLPRTRRSA